MKVPRGNTRAQDARSRTSQVNPACTSDGRLVVVRTWRADPAALKVAYKRARSLLRVRDPMIAAVLACELREDALSITAEYVPGVTLDRWIEIHGLPEPAAACNLVERLAQSLEALHRRGVAHHALYPAKLLVCEPETDDGGMSAKLLDLAVTGAMRSWPPRLEAAHFVAPEALSSVRAPLHASDSRGRAATPRQPTSGGPNGVVDPLMNVYSLGCLLHYLCTGQPPFQSDSIERLRSIHGRGAAAFPRALNPHISRELEATIQQALAFDRRARVASAGALATALSPGYGRPSHSSARRSSLPPPPPLPRAESQTAARARSSILPEERSSWANDAPASRERRTQPPPPPAAITRTAVRRTSVPPPPPRADTAVARRSSPPPLPSVQARQDRDSEPGEGALAARRTLIPPPPVLTTPREQRASDVTEVESLRDSSTRRRSSVASLLEASEPASWEEALQHARAREGEAVAQGAAIEQKSATCARSVESADRVDAVEQVPLASKAIADSQLDWALDTMVEELRALPSELDPALDTYQAIELPEDSHEALARALTVEPSASDSSALAEFDARNEWSPATDEPARDWVWPTEALVADAEAEPAEPAPSKLAAEQSLVVATTSPCSGEPGDALEQVSVIAADPIAVASTSDASTTSSVPNAVEDVGDAACVEAVEAASAAAVEAANPVVDPTEAASAEAVEQSSALIEAASAGTDAVEAASVAAVESAATEAIEAASLVSAAVEAVSVEAVEVASIAAVEAASVVSVAVEAARVEAVEAAIEVSAAVEAASVDAAESADGEAVETTSVATDAAEAASAVTDMAEAARAESAEAASVVADVAEAVNIDAVEAASTEAAKIAGVVSAAVEAVSVGAADSAGAEAVETTGVAAAAVEAVNVAAAESAGAEAVEAARPADKAPVGSDAEPRVVAGGVAAARVRARAGDNAAEARSVEARAIAAPAKVRSATAASRDRAISEAASKARAVAAAKARAAADAAAKARAVADDLTARSVAAADAASKARAVADDVTARVVTAASAAAKPRDVADDVTARVVTAAPAAAGDKDVAPRAKWSSITANGLSPRPVVPNELSSAFASASIDPQTAGAVEPAPFLKTDSSWPVPSEPAPSAPTSTYEVATPARVVSEEFVPENGVQVPTSDQSATRWTLVGFGVSDGLGRDESVDPPGADPWLQAAQQARQLSRSSTLPIPPISVGTAGRVRTRSRWAVRSRQLLVPLTAAGVLAVIIATVRWPAGPSRDDRYESVIATPLAPAASSAAGRPTLAPADPVVITPPAPREAPVKLAAAPEPAPPHEPRQRHKRAAATETNIPAPPPVWPDPEPISLEPSTRDLQLTLGPAYDGPQAAKLAPPKPVVPTKISTPAPALPMSHVSLPRAAKIEQLTLLGPVAAIRVHRALERIRPQLTLCYEQHAPADARQRLSPVHVELVLNELGRVRTTDVRGASSLALGECVASASKKLQLGTPDTGRVSIAWTTTYGPLLPAATITVKPEVDRGF